MKDIVGRHLSEFEMLQVIEYRCKEMNIEVLNVTNMKNLKTAEIQFKCSQCGNICIRNFHSVFTYKTSICHECKNKNKGIDKKKDYTRNSLEEKINEIYNGKFSIIEDYIYHNNKQRIKIKCNECGLKQDARIDVLMQNRKRCKCSKIRSKLEYQISNILKKYNIVYSTEFTFEDLKITLPLRFDFKIEKDNNIYLIEADGIQHFYPTFGDESFEHTRQSDIIKNEYVEKHKIPLLRIKYDEKNIENKIKEFLNL